MNQYDILSSIQAAAAMLDPDEAPESAAYLNGIAADEDPVLDPYVVANRLLKCDEPDPLPAGLRDLIEELFTAAFEDGNADAMNDLGAQYYDGSRGFEQDFTKSVDCYKRAAAGGSRQAWENLGYCYYYGRDMPVDYEKAFHCFALGAFDGHLISLYKIGDMYQKGYYVEKNPTEAFHIYTRCLETMTDEAAGRVAGPVFLRVGNALLNGLGTKEDDKGALVCFQKAESFLYDMVAGGDAMYQASLQAAVEGQAKAREKLAEALPAKEWEFD
jgi:TPR repeat protein